MNSTLENPPSPAELAKLETAFATDPSSDAYRPLAEAYLGLGRFMEAMVVCKKGVKAHPDAAAPRLLLARVYAEQGKSKKALDEATAALKYAAGDPMALRVAGLVQMKAGDPESGRKSLIEAWQAGPGDAETRRAMDQWNVPIPATPAPAPAAPAAAPPTAAPAPSTAATQGAPTPPGEAAPTAAEAARTPSAPSVGGSPGAPPPEAASAPAGGAGQLASAGSRGHGTPPAATGASTGPAPGSPEAPPVLRPSGVRPRSSNAGRPATAPAAAASRGAARPTAASPYDPYEDEDERPRASGTQKKLFLGLALLVPIALIGYSVLGKMDAQRKRDFRKHLTEATEQLKHDSYDSYKKATDSANLALELDPSSATAHAYLAYVHAIRFGEHGAGDAARKLSEDHLREAKAADDGESNSHLLAAEALLTAYAGDEKKAGDALAAEVAELEVKGRRSALLYLTLGLIQLRAGDLQAARGSLESAQSLAQDDPRVYAALGSLYQELGQDRVAWQNYDFALRYERNHPDSRLGKAWLVIEQPTPNLPIAARLIGELIKSDPPPSPRQLATAHMLQAFLLSRVASELPRLDGDAKKALAEVLEVPLEPARLQAKVREEEELAVKLDRSNPELHLIRGRRLFHEGQVEAAASEIERAQKLDPSRARFQVALARLHLARGAADAAIRQLESARGAAREATSVRVLLGDAYLQKGELAEAEKRYRSALDTPETRSPDARLGLAKVNLARKRFDAAEKELDQAQREFVGQSARLSATHTVRAQILQARGRTDDAEAAFREALQMDPGFAPAYFHYASFLASARNDGAKASTAAREYLNLAPRGEHAQQAQRLIK